MQYAPAYWHAGAEGHLFGRVGAGRVGVESRGFGGRGLGHRGLAGVFGGLFGGAGREQNGGRSKQREPGQKIFHAGSNRIEGEGVRGGGTSLFFAVGPLHPGLGVFDYNTLALESRPNLVHLIVGLGSFGLLVEA